MKFFRNIKDISIPVIVVVLIVIFTISLVNIDSSSVQTSSILTNGYSNDNKKIGWGIKRVANHEQPELGNENISIMNEYKGIYLGNKDKKCVYLTFDNGYEEGYTPQILDTLKQNEVTATFFITAHYLNTQTDLVKRMIDDGHIVGNHTVNHKSMPDLNEDKIKQEVMDLHKTVYEKTGYEMTYIRPPMGEYSRRTASITNSLGYQTVMWSLAYDDWDVKKQGREEYGKTKILDNIHPGAVILLHATSKDNANILDSVIKEIKNMGYEFKSLDDFER